MLIYLYKYLTLGNVLRYYLQCLYFVSNNVLRDLLSMFLHYYVITIRYISKLIYELIQC